MLRNPGAEVAAYFVARCDVSELCLAELHNSLLRFESFLECFGFGIAQNAIVFRDMYLQL